MLQVRVAHSPRPGCADEVEVALADGATLRDALQASGVLAGPPALDPAALRVGVWGALRSLDTPLREGDRVEVYRPLQVDPMQARRLRQRQQATKRRSAATGSEF